MVRITNVICPYLKGSTEGARCSTVDRLVREMEGFTIKLCMSRHHEVCPLYFAALKEENMQPTAQSSESGT